ncbi:MAG: 4-alpha-glucanotransferase, partial [Eubacteriales bacterium]|nr:4-alpha-glucanotransferase [Eubacteriales bacterium]
MDHSMKKRCNAILAHLSSMPSPFGIGVMGEESLDFAKKLAAADVSYWQILPINYPAEDSPYQAYSAFAGNPAFIDPRGLVEEGLLESDELAQYFYSGDPCSCDYDFVRRNSQAYLEAAYTRISQEQVEAVRAFIDSSFWLDDYALYMTIHELESGQAFWLWRNEALKYHEAAALDDFRRQNYERYFYHCFVQWLFFKQWIALKEEINELGLGIFGDIPFYVSSDSADIWSHSDQFMLQADLRPLLVAGVPPDYFSEDGQLWGNTIYNFAAMERDSYAWWLRRIAASLRLYDLLRIDHFRGFSSYWVVPSDAETARHGAWWKGPGMRLFRRIRSELGAVPIVAEDLGDIDAEVKQFLVESGFPGMKVLQFAFDREYLGKDLPHNYPKNVCAYTGTHDNDTALGWVESADPIEL